MDINDIKALIASMAASDLAEMEVSKDGWTLRLSRHAAVRQPALASPAPIRVRPAEMPPPAASPDFLAPLSGVVHLHPAPGAAAFVRDGAKIAAGDTLCLIEAMKVFNAVRAERDGIVAAVLVATGSEVEAGQVLMRIT